MKAEYKTNLAFRVLGFFFFAMGAGSMAAVAKIAVAYEGKDMSTGMTFLLIACIVANGLGHRMSGWCDAEVDRAASEKNE